MAEFGIFSLIMAGTVALGISMAGTSECLDNQRSLYHKMKNYVKRKRLMKTKKIDSEEICVICFEDFTDRNRHRCSTMRGCEHKFHSRCLNKWLKERLVCPLCNIDLDK